MLRFRFGGAFAWCQSWCVTVLSVARPQTHNFIVIRRAGGPNWLLGLSVAMRVGRSVQGAGRLSTGELSVSVCRSVSALSVVLNI